jgi:acyl homoserine lactone synthase
MAILIEAADRGAQSELMDAGYRLRRKIFIDTLGWSVPDLAADGEREIDQFDDLPATRHLVSVNAAGRVVGTARLTPADAPNLTCDVLQSHFPLPLPRSPRIVESSRMCVDQTLSREERTAVMGDLYVANMELCAREGWTQIMGVYYQSSLAELIRQGFAVDALGAPMRFAPGDPFSYPYLLTCDEGSVARMAAWFGVEGSRLQAAPRRSVSRAVLAEIAA